MKKFCLNESDMIETKTDAKLNEVKLGQILGKGMFGQTYSVCYDNKKYALKIQKILKKDMNKSSKSGIWREIKFYKFIDSLSKYEQTYFMKMHKYEFHKCDHKYKRPFKIQKKKFKVF